MAISTKNRMLSSENERSASELFQSKASEENLNLNKISTNNFKASIYYNFSECVENWLKLEVDGASTAYQTARWIGEICKTLANRAKFTPVFVELIDSERDEIVMMLALGLSHRLGVKIINHINFGVCDYAAPLLAADVQWTTKSAQEAWATICAALPAADLIDIEQIPIEIDGVANPLALLPHRRLMELKAYGIPIEAQSETLVARSMGSKPFRELNRRRRRLEDLGDIRFVEAKTQTELDEIYAVMVNQRRGRFEKLGRFDLLSKPRYADFYKTVASDSLTNGGLARVFGVSINGEWISTAYILTHKGVFHGIIMSMGKDDWIKYGPGLLIVTELMKWSEQQGHVYFDLTIGDMPYKNDIHPVTRDLFRIIQPRSPLGAFVIKILDRSEEFVKWIDANTKIISNLRNTRRSVRRAISQLKNKTPDKN